MTPITDKLAEAPMSARKLIELCRDALAEELGAWDIDPPLHHVKEAHDACVAWLASQQAEPRCDCGKKPASQCDKWEEGCDLGQDPRYARVVMPKQAEPSEARVEAGAMALAAIWEGAWGDVPADMKEGLRNEARAVLQAADAVGAVPDGFVPVPLSVLEDAARALGCFVSDEGWSDADMQAMDNIDAYIARHKANAAAPGSEQKEGAR